MAAPASKHRVQDFIDAIPGTGGIISTIAKKVGCSWHTAKRYIETYPTIAQAYADECAVVLDLAETKVISAINDGDIQTAKWYLTMKGQGRGYTRTERCDVTSGGQPLTFRVVYDRDERSAFEDDADTDAAQ